jgi:hypothetical protein
VKPGNFLLKQVAEQLELRVSDLGFAADAQGVRDNVETVAYNPRDPGALALGTVRFRSPEAREGGGEVKFEIASPAADRRLVRMFRPFAMVRPERGDWLQPVDASLLSASKRFARIETVKEDNRYWECALSEALAEETTPGVALQGYVLRTIDQVSDLFSLGCLVYFIASGGNDPETFYDKFIADPNLSATLAADSSDEVDESGPLVIAALLADDYRGWVDLVEELREAEGSHESRGRRFRDWFSRAVQRYTMEWIPTSTRLLRDGKGHRLSFPVLYFVVCCMLRGGRGAVVPARSSENRVDGTLCDEELWKRLNLCIGVAERRRARNLTELADKLARVDADPLVAFCRTIIFGQGDDRVPATTKIGVPEKSDNAARITDETVARTDPLRRGAPMQGSSVVRDESER